MLKRLAFLLVAVCVRLSFANAAEPVDLVSAWNATEIQPIECYVRFVDQDGKAVSNVPVDAAVYTKKSDNTAGPEKFLRDLVTDDDGRLHVSGERGGALWLKLNSPRYLHGSTAIGSQGGSVLQYSKISSEGNRNYGTAQQPAVIRVWKKEGPQPLVELHGELLVPYEGKPVHLDLTSGRIVDDGGDLLINPEMPLTEAERRAQADPRGVFPFKCTLEVIGGGLRPFAPYTDEFNATNGIFEEGLQPSITGNGINFCGAVSSRQGAVHGKIKILIGVESMRRGSGRLIVRIDDALINGTGSKSLEVDPGRLTKVTTADGRAPTPAKP